ncbi:MAG: FAD-dependent oxidoreductase [Candidatus Latescibacterota bacterium]|nr:FAD-dependent oxidoreductase [Candidatus Latescibacterota bacterium]
MSILQTHELECDVLVAGGGPAGVPCALAAARNGARVILCQDRPVLGGNASSEVRMHIVGADASGSRGLEGATEAREGGILEEIRLETSLRNPQRSASMLDLILYEKCRAEPNLTLMLNTAVDGATVFDGQIVEASALRQSTEDRFDIKAHLFVDCTGDGRLGLEAGAAFREGRESKAEFGEPQAQEEADNKRLGSTLLFQARQHDYPVPFVAPPWVRKFTEHDLRLRPHGAPGVDRGLEYGYWWVEWGGVLNTVKDNETIRDELLAIMLGVWNHIKNDGDHGADCWALDWFGFLPGKRESRRFVGQHVLSENDILAARPFDDTIAYGGWSLDTHPPEGVDAVDLPPCNQPKPPHLYDIPLRSCVSSNVENLMFAGRNISATHVGFSSTRVMATCAVIGQGVGTAAAFAALHERSAVQLAGDAKAISAIQQRLLRDDAFLIGYTNSDEHDVAPQATIRASSEVPGGEAVNVVSGQTRSVHGEGGAAPDVANPGSHRWMSDAAQGFPAWLELRWPKSVRVARVQLVFDTGLHRVLTLSHSDAYVERMKYGCAQPETIQAYQLEAEVSGQWQSLVHITDNYQRLNIHNFDSTPTIDALRLTIETTHGLDHARLCEIRVSEQIVDWSAGKR